MFFSSDYGKEKFMYFNYEIKNVLRIVWNDILMDFMKSMEEFKGLEYLDFKENNKFRNDVGDKYFDVKFYINDLMSVIVLILLNLNDIE